MPVNYNILSQLAAPKIIAQLPASAGEGDDFGSLLSGISGLVGGITHAVSPTTAPVPTSYANNTGTYGTNSFSSNAVPSQVINNPTTLSFSPRTQNTAVGGLVPSNSPIPTNLPASTNPWVTQASQNPLSFRYQGNTGTPSTSNTPASPHYPQPNQQLNTTVGSQSIFDNAMKQYGLKEGNNTLNSYLSKANPNLDPTVTPWCAGFVGSVLNASGLKGTGSLAAKSYLNYGAPTKTPQKGDIVVFNDLSGRNDPVHGHVGFVDRVENGKVYTLGGNQDNSVSIKAFPMSSVAGFRVVPTGQEVQKFAAQNNIQSPHQLAQITNTQDQNLQAAMAGIAHVESSGYKDPYSAISKPSRNGDQAYGKFQIMGNNIPAWSKEALGRPITKQEFLSNPQLQEQIASFKINQYLKETGNLEDTWSMWFSGRPVNKAGNARDVYGTTVPGYIKKAKEGVSQYLHGMQTTLNDYSPLVPRGNTTPPPSQLPQPMQGTIPNVPSYTGRGSLASLSSGANNFPSNMPVINPYSNDQMPISDGPSEPEPNSQMASNGINWGLLAALSQKNQYS